MQTPDLEPLVVYGGYKKLTGILCRISIYFREEAKFDRVPLPQRVSIYSLQGQTAWLILLGEPHYEGNTLKWAPQKEDMIGMWKLEVKEGLY